MPKVETTSELARTSRPPFRLWRMVRLRKLAAAKEAFLMQSTKQSLRARLLVVLFALIALAGCARYSVCYVTPLHPGEPRCTPPVYTRQMATNIVRQGQTAAPELEHFVRRAR